MPDISTGIRSEPVVSTLLVGTALGLMFAAGDMRPAMAQSTDAPTLPPVSVEGTRATTEGYKADFSASPKYTAPLLDTPKTITVIPKEYIEDRAALSLQDVLRTTPGITLGAGEGGVPATDRPSIRGFDATTDTFVDGVRDVSSQNREVFNLESVEISKGPNSAFAGRGSTGGSINLISKTPKAENFATSSLTLGTDWTKRLTGDANYKIGDDSALRINVMGHDADVAGRDEVHQSRLGIAPSLALGMTGPTRVTLSLYHLRTDDIPDYGIPYDPRTGKPAEVDRNNFYGLTDRDFSRINTTIGTARIEHDLKPNMTIRNTTRYGFSENNFLVTNPDDSRGNVPNGVVWRNTKSRNSDTTTFINQTDLYGDFELASLKNTYSVGFEYSNEAVRNRGYAVTVGSSTCGVADFASYNCTSLSDPNPNDPWNGTISPATTGTETRTTTKAIYGFDTVQLNEQFSLNFGLRFDMYDTTQDTNASGALTNRSNKDDFLNYSLGAVYKPLPNGSIYISYGTSTNPSGEGAGDGSSTLSAANTLLEPEENRSIEIGSKWDLMNSRLAVSGAIFQIDKKNARTTSAITGLQENAGDQRVRGFELGLSGSITPNWKVFGGYTFIDGEITDGGDQSVAGNRVNGNRLPNTPTHSGSIWTTYTFLKDYTVGGGANYVGHRFGNTANTREVDAYWRFDAMAAYRVNETINLQLNVINIFDEVYYDKPYTTHFATLGAGRTALLTTSFKF